MDRLLSAWCDILCHVHFDRTCVFDESTVAIGWTAAVIDMKRDTVRPLDHADAAALRRTFDLEDE